MTDSPEFRAWADRAHRESLRPHKSKRTLYKCTACPHRSTRKQAKMLAWNCAHCGSPLRAKRQEHSND